MQDVHETDLDGNSGAVFDVSESSSDSTVDLLHEPPDSGKEEFVFLASHYLIESCLDCCSLLAGSAATVNTSTNRVDLSSVVDDAKEIEMKSLQSHSNLMAFADTLTLDMNVQLACESEN